MKKSSLKKLIFSGLAAGLVLGSSYSVGFAAGADTDITDPVVETGSAVGDPVKIKPDGKFHSVSHPYTKGYAGAEVHDVTTETISSSKAVTGTMSEFDASNNEVTADGIVIVGNLVGNVSLNAGGIAASIIINDDIVGGSGSDEGYVAGVRIINKNNDAVINKADSVKIGKTEVTVNAGKDIGATGKSEVAGVVIGGGILGNDATNKKTEISLGTATVKVGGDSKLTSVENIQGFHFHKGGTTTNTIAGAADHILTLDIGKGGTAADITATKVVDGVSVIGV